MKSIINELVKQGPRWYSEKELCLLRPSIDAYGLVPEKLFNGHRPPFLLYRNGNNDKGGRYNVSGSAAGSAVYSPTLIAFALMSKNEPLEGLQINLTKLSEDTGINNSELEKIFGVLPGLYNADYVPVQHTPLLAEYARLEEATKNKGNGSTNIKNSLIAFARRIALLERKSEILERIDDTEELKDFLMSDSRFSEPAVKKQKSRIVSKSPGELDATDIDWYTQINLTEQAKMSQNVFKAMHNPTFFSYVEELSHTLRVKERKDIDARNELVANYRAYVVDVAVNQLHLSAAADVQILQEVISTANVEMILAAERFDPWRGNKFLTFIKPRLRGAMLNYLESERAGSGTSFKHLKKLVSLEELVDGMKEEGLSVTNTDLSAYNIGDYRDDTFVHSNCEKRIQLEAVKKAFGGLKEKEQKVIKMVFFDGERTGDVAEKMGCSDSYVSRIKEKGIQTLRRRLCANGWRDELIPAKVGQR